MQDTGRVFLLPSWGQSHGELGAGSGSDPKDGPYRKGCLF